jgi:hypothetical protein
MSPHPGGWTTAGLDADDPGPLLKGRRVPADQEEDIH